VSAWPAAEKYIRDNAISHSRADYFYQNARITIDRTMRRIFNPILFGLLGVMYAELPLLVALAIAVFGLDQRFGVTINTGAILPITNGASRLPKRRTSVDPMSVACSLSDGLPYSGDCDGARQLPWVLPVDGGRAGQLLHPDVGSLVHVRHDDPEVCGRRWWLGGGMAG
jgi:hypothetical protein